MPTERIQTSEALTTTLKGDTLELEFFYSILDEERFLKAYDDECAGNLILILTLEKENIVFNLSKPLVLI
jgi:hypothetical protein